MRERVFVPIPQVAEQEDQCIQSDQWPSPRNENQSASNDNIVLIVKMERTKLTINYLRYHSKNADIHVYTI